MEGLKIAYMENKCEKPKKIDIEELLNHSCEFDCKGCISSGWNQAVVHYETYLKESKNELVEALGNCISRLNYIGCPDSSCNQGVIVDQNGEPEAQCRWCYEDGLAREILAKHKVKDTNK